MEIVIILMIETVHIKNLIITIKLIAIITILVSNMTVEPGGGEGIRKETFESGVLNHIPVL